MEPDKALTKLMDFCARGEKCTKDVKDKLKRWELTEEQIDAIIRQLQEQKFIDDSRYALAFANDKNRFNFWGKTKIRYHLQSKGITSELIRAALNEINEEEYQVQLEDMLRKKIRGMIPIEDPYQAKAKLVRFAASRGFEAELIFSTLDRLLKDATD